jgi:outer membrane protein assembly factor BamB
MCILLFVNLTNDIKTIIWQNGMKQISYLKLSNFCNLILLSLLFTNTLYSQVGEIKWKVPTNIIGWSSPAIGPDGTVYIGDNDGYLYAVVDEGETWSFKWEPIKLADDVGECCPTVTTDGKRLYIGSNTRPAKMFCVNPEDGSVNWSYTLPQNKTLYAGGLISSPAFSHDEKTIYFGSGPWDSDLEPGPTTWLDDRFFAIEDLGDTYKVKWIFKPDDKTDAVRFSFFGNPAIDTDGSIYIGSFNGYFYKLKDNVDHCTVLWKNKFIREIETSVTKYQEVWGSPTIGPDGTVYITTNDWRLWAFNPDGNVKWFFDTDHETWTTPVFTNNGLIVFGSEDGYMYGIRDDGSKATEVWHYPEVSSGAWWGTCAVVEDGTIIFGSEVVDGEEKGVYYAIDEKDGSYKWQTPSLGFEARTHPAIGEDGTIYVGGGEAGNLYAIRGTSPLANSPWPKMQGDNLNSGVRKFVKER